MEITKSCSAESVEINELSYLVPDALPLKSLNAPTQKQFELGS